MLLCAGAFNVVNNFLSSYGFQYIPAILASNLLTLQPLFALVISMALYGEMPVIKELAGGAIIIASALAMHRAQAREPVPDPQP